MFEFLAVLWWLLTGATPTAPAGGAPLGPTTDPDGKLGPMTDPDG